MRGCFIGRFQPFHLGHLKAIEWILDNKCNELVIAIGSANIAFTFKNPFTIGERIEMIVRVFKSLNLINKVYICTVPDTYGEHSIWYSYLKHWCPKFDIVFTNDEFTKLCLEYGGFKVENTPFFDREKYSGTYIRKLIAQGIEDWKNLVHQEVVNFIEEVNGVERIRKLAKIEGII